MIAYNVKLVFSSNKDKNDLLKTLEIQKDVWNYISNIIFKNECTNKKLIHDKTYHPARKKFKKAKSQTIIRARADVISAYQSALSNGRTWEQMKDKELSNGVPFKKEALSMRLDKRLYTYQGTTGIRLTTLNKPINCKFLLYPKIIELFEKYSISDPLLFVRDGDVYLSIPFNTPEVKNKGTLIVGIDVGERRFVTTSEGLCLAGRDLQEYNRIVNYNRRYWNKHKQSHSARYKLKSSKKKRRNYNKQYCEITSNILLDSTPADVIAMEDLDGIKKNEIHKTNKEPKNKELIKYRNRKKNQYPWKQLLDIMRYKALLRGKQVATVDPFRTSLDDYRNIIPGVRSGSRYSTSDGKVFDSDHQAGCTIGCRLSDRLKLPLSYREPLSGCLYFKSRLSQEPIVNHSSMVGLKIRQALHF